MAKEILDDKVKLAMRIHFPVENLEERIYELVPMGSNDEGRLRVGIFTIANELIHHFERREADLNKEIERLKSESSLWNRSWHEQRVTTGAAYWSGYRRGWKVAFDKIKSMMFKLPYA